MTRFVFLMVILFLLAACSREEAEPWLTVGESRIYEDEVMLYLFQTYNDFEAYGGEDVWLIEDFSGGKSAGEVAKQGALENLIRSKVLAKKASTLGIEVGDAARSELQQEAGNYFEELPAPFVVPYNITEETVMKVFEDTHISSLVVAQTLTNYKPDEEALQDYLNANEDYRRIAQVDTGDILTVYRVQHLVVRTHVMTADGQWEAMLVEKQEEAAATIENLRQRLLEGEDFLAVAKEASALDYEKVGDGGFEYSKSQLPAAFYMALDAIEPGDMTDVIQGETGYHIFYLEEKRIPSEEEVLAFEERFAQWEKALLVEAGEVLRKGVFDDIYKDWKESTTISYSQHWIDLEFTDYLPAFKGQERTDD